MSGEEVASVVAVFSDVATLVDSVGTGEVSEADDDVNGVALDSSVVSGVVVWLSDSVTEFEGICEDELSREGALSVVATVTVVDSELGTLLDDSSVVVTVVVIVSVVVSVVLDDTGNGMQSVNEVEPV